MDFSLLDKMIKNQKEDVCTIHGTYSSYLMPNGMWSKCPVCTLQATKDENLRESIDSQRTLRERAHRAKLRQIKVNSEVPARYQEASFDSYQVNSSEQAFVLKACKRYVEIFDDRYNKGGCLTLLGGTGTGKTHLACAIINSLALSSYSVLYTEVYEALDYIKEVSRFERSMSERKAIEKYESVDLLILDELGVQQNDDWEKLVIFKIINNRYKANKPTILVSNLDKEAFAAHVGGRVIDRIKENGGMTLTLSWESYRK